MKAQEKASFLAIGLLAGLAISSNIFSAVHHKSFWLDEIFVLYNLKFSSLESLFGPFYGAPFPRAYLAIIQQFATVFNFSFVSLRLIPLSIQCLNVVLFALVFRKFAPAESRRYLGLISLIFLCNDTTVWCFSQVKQYSMELLCALIAMLQCYYLFISPPQKTHRQDPSLRLLLCRGLSELYIHRLRSAHRPSFST